MNIVTLATCHNRREKTLRALTDLHSQKIFTSVAVHHVLVDDGSCDGTKQAVSQAFPSVQIIPGTGELYWAGGMRHGWEQSVKDKEFDYLLVYNDDVHLDVDAIQRLLDASSQYLSDDNPPEHIVAGAFRSDRFTETSYGGVIRQPSLNPLKFGLVDPPFNSFRRVDTVNMNLCLISSRALEKIGFLSDFFSHRAADYEYGLRLVAAGGSAILAPGYVGVCERNENFYDKKVGLFEGYRFLLSKKEQPPIERMIYYRIHGGWFWPIWWLAPYVAYPLKKIWRRFKRVLSLED